MGRTLLLRPSAYIPQRLSRASTHAIHHRHSRLRPKLRRPPRRDLGPVDNDDCMEPNLQPIHRSRLLRYPVRMFSYESQIKDHRSSHFRPGCFWNCHDRGDSLYD